jgi:copper oxidase (laccase) domain-containing protein
VHALCTSREGGVSAAPWGSLNLGDHVGDDPQAVRANRQRLQEALRAWTPGACAVFLQQVHGVDVAVLDADSAQGQAFDACVTGAPGVACTIMVADCLPVLLAHRGGAVVGAAHAGWRGLAGGVLETLFERFAGQIETPPGQVAQQMQEFLPQAATPEEVSAAIDAALAEVAAQGVTGAPAMGKVMALLKQALAGRADMTALSQQVKARLA